MTMQPPRGFSLRGGRMPPTEQLRSNWGWFLALGILALVAGFAALAIEGFATLVSVVTVGVLVGIVGIVEIVLGFQARGWGQALYWEVSGLFYLAVGIFAWAEPVQASVVITLLLGAGLLAAGVVRLVSGFQHHDRMRGPPWPPTPIARPGRPWLPSCRSLAGSPFPNGTHRGPGGRRRRSRTAAWIVL